MKQLLVIRKDLKMRRGKECAQCAHASLGAYVNGGMNNSIPQALEHISTWWNNGQAKITVTVNSEQEMDELHARAVERNMITYQVVDHGRTEFNGVHTKTVLAIGPAPDDMFIGLTDHLPLY